MKLKNLKLPIAVSALLAMSVTSCLKDSRVEDGLYNINLDNAPALAQVLGTQAGNPLKILSLDFSTNDTTFEGLVASIAADKPVAQETKITIALDPSLITAYNTANGTHLKELPASGYTLPTGLVITIPAGSREGTLYFKSKPSFIATDSFAIGLRLSSVSDASIKLSSNFQTMLIKLGVKNKFDATYSDLGYVYHPTAPRSLAADKVLPTVGANSVEATLGDLGASGYKAILTVDPVTNKVTVTAAPGAAGGAYTQFDSGLPTTNPGYTAGWSGSDLIGANGNRYDPATKTFYLRYGYLGANGWRVSEEILKRK